MNLCNNTEEQFKPIKDFEGLYEAGNLGSIKSLITNKILKPQNNLHYNYIDLYKNNKRSNKIIHRLIAMAFIPNLENKSEVNHINGIKTDNRVENLEWVTAKENCKHALMIGLMNARIRSLSKQTLDLYTGIVFDSLKIACKSLNLNYNKEYYKIRFKKNNTRLQYI